MANMKLLIADDDPTTREMVGAFLEPKGFEVVEAADGNAALAVLMAPDAPRVAVLDWIMPGLDGPEICRRIRQNSSAPPPYIIILSGKDRAADIVAGLQAGADDYIRKPFGQDEFVARVEVGMRIVRLQTSLAERVQELEAAIAHVRQLQGILPICSSCKKVRNDRGSWQAIESYVREHSDADFSHSICPECAAKLYPRF